MLSYRKFNSIGISIVLLSIILNILLMPLYRKAEEIQLEENNKQKSMKKGVDAIKKAFSGDEEYMILNTYYRQNNYKPIYSLRSSLSLLLQIPFFIAAYNFLSDSSLLNGVSFGLIRDLSLPDGLFFGLNIIPILMTIINIVSCIVYSKGQPLKNNGQLYLMALLFLVLLYDSPSALSLYYLLNNVFSLIKNIIDKSKYKSIIIKFFVLFLCIAGLLLVLLGNFSFKTKLLICFILFVLFMLTFFRDYIRKYISVFNNINLDSKYFLFCTVLLFVLTGLLIPTNVIVSSSEEFISRLTYTNPLIYVLNTSLLAFGFFVIWPNIIYRFIDDNVKPLFSFIVLLLCFVFLIDYSFFTKNLGSMSNLLIYDRFPHIDRNIVIINYIVILFVSAIIYVLYKKYGKLLSKSIVVITITMIILSLVNVVKINKQVRAAYIKMSDSTNSKYLSLSRNKDNVIVIMLDRAISMYFPYLLNERPELLEQFSGFTYYPNTISFGGFTNTGVPALFGGYEYTPEEMNKRDNELLSDKHNEALKVMPVIFGENGFNVLVSDPPYAGYSWIPDLTIYNDCKNVKAVVTEGIYNTQDDGLKYLNRNLFCYSLSEVTPIAFHNLIYDKGKYLSSNFDYSFVKSKSFSDSFNTLKNLISMTDVADGNGSLLLLQNCTTHEPVYLSDYDKVLVDDDSITQYKGQTINKTSINGDIISLKDSDSIENNQIMHYQINMAAMLQLGKWFDYLKENNVYDNTRIIVVSDHGRNLGHKDNYYLDGEDMMMYNPLFLIKDFNSKEFKIDYSFMTNADTVYYATKDIIDNPVNPFTGKDIVELDKNGVSFSVFGTHKYDIEKNNGNTFMKDKWYSVHDNCLDINNWKLINDPSDK